MENFFKKASLTMLLISGVINVTYANSGIHTNDVQSAVIIGSAESPDPIVERVRELERQGILKDVIIMESFPVQIRLTGPKSVIEELRAMPKKTSPDFK